jgi:hypothetical protein
MDVANPQKLAKLKKYCEKRRIPFLTISAVTGEGIPKLKYEIAAMVRQMRQGNYHGPKPVRPRVAPVKAKTTVATKVAKAARIPAKRKPARKLVSSKPASKAVSKTKSTGGKARAAKRPKKLSGRKRSER